MNIGTDSFGFFKERESAWSSSTFMMFRRLAMAETQNGSEDNKEGDLAEGRHKTTLGPYTARLAGETLDGGNTDGTAGDVSGNHRSRDNE